MAHGSGNPRQELRQGQRQELRLETRLLQSLEVLALPAQELAAHLREAYTENEALRLEEPAAALPRSLERRRRGPAPSDDDAHARWLANLPAREATWRERLLEQAPDACDPAWFALVVEALDDDGLLRASDPSLLAEAASRELPGGEASLGRAIAAVQGLEPRGIGARDGAEVLLLQLDREDADYGALCVLVEQHLDDVLANKLPRIARRLALPVEEVERLRARLATLEPRPSLAADDTAAAPLRPELRVEWTGSGFELAVLGDGLPQVSLDDDVLRLARDRSQPAAVRERLREGLSRARALLTALEQRAETLRRVAVAVFARQRPFLEHGPSRLAPLYQQEIADALGLHPSTISRAIAGKSIDTPWGVVPLREFFQAPAPGGEGTARDVRVRLAAAIAGEDPRAPLSDDDLAARLASDGFVLARRTVAKLRTELGVPSSYRRRRFAA